jgi:hypothetical protein
MATKRRTKKTDPETAVAPEAAPTPDPVPIASPAPAPVTPPQPKESMVPFQTFVLISGIRSKDLAGYARYVGDCMSGKKLSITDWRKDWEAFRRRPV